MSIQWYDESDTDTHENSEAHTTSMSINTQLERRRRIEELLEEKKLRDEIWDY